VSVRPYRGSFEPVGVAHEVTSHIEPLAPEARPVCSRGHRVKHDSRMLDRPQRPVGAVNVPILSAQSFALIPQPPGNAYTSRAGLPRNPGRHLLGRKQRIEIRAPTYLPPITVLAGREVVLRSRAGVSVIAYPRLASIAGGALARTGWCWPLPSSELGRSRIRPG